jgi:gamma-glutamylcyclotransferase (GGCT)/AIG2-like uncharacterized protein YtfP
MLLFVYGTLRRSETAAHLMRGAEFVCDGRVRGHVIRTEAGYRGLTAGDDWVEGELFRVTEELLARLDEYEGPGYERRQSEIHAGDKQLTAWVYWLG